MRADTIFLIGLVVVVLGWLLLAISVYREKGVRSFPTVTDAEPKENGEE